MMTSISTKYYQFILAQGLCSAIGTSAIYFSATSSVATWFKDRRAFAIGAMISGASVGGVIFPIMVYKLVPLVGFGWTVRICAFLILIVLIIANLTVRSHLQPTPRPINLRGFIMSLTDRVFLMVVCSCFLFFFGLFLPFNYVIEVALQDGMPRSLSGYLVSILNGAR
jgi:MFS family permease